MDFLTITLLSLTGIFLGTITGLIPGIHTNTIAILFYLFYLNHPVNPFHISLILFSMTITHSFTSFIPSTYLNIPEESTYLSLSLTQKYSRKNLSHKAIILTITGGISIILLYLITLPFIINLYPYIYSTLKPFIAIFLLIFTLTTIIFSKNKTNTLISITSSGLLGLLILHSKINKNYILFPLFAGLFGLSHILLTLNHNHKTTNTKKSKKVEINPKDIIKGTTNGYLSSLLSTLIPSLGITSSTLITRKITKLKTNDSLLISLGGTTTLEALLSILTIYLIKNAKSGTAVIINNLTTLTFDKIILFSLLFLLISSLSSYITLKISSFLQKHPLKNPKAINYLLIALITTITITTTGLIGIITLTTSTLIGIFTIKNNLSKTLMNFVLIIPTILIYL